MLVLSKTLESNWCEPLLLLVVVVLLLLLLVLLLSSSYYGISDSIVVLSKAHGVNLLL